MIRIQIRRLRRRRLRRRRLRLKPHVAVMRRIRPDVRHLDSLLALRHTAFRADGREQVDCEGEDVEGEDERDDCSLLAGCTQC
jgi:hypothetical protein